MKRLYRSTKDKKLAGICGGLGEYLNADSNMIRLAFVLLLLVTGFFPFGLTYIVAWIILPEDVMLKKEEKENNQTKSKPNVKAKPKPKTRRAISSS